MTITSCGNTTIRSTENSEPNTTMESPQEVVIEDNEEAVGDMAEAHYIIISKESMTLKLYDKDSLLICRFPIAAGKNYGNKQHSGDMKTPEGEFTIEQIQNATHWLQDFGDGKGEIKGSYGNWFIRLKTPPHRGIGIHGTHTPTSIGSRTTDGCIQLYNHDLDSLKAMVNIGMAVRIESSVLDRKADGIEEPIATPSVANEAPEVVEPIENATPIIESEQEVIQSEQETVNEEVVKEEVVKEEAVKEEIIESQQVESTDIAEPEVKDVWHTVADGDLVGRIAAKYGITISEIKRLNPDLNVDKISIGQKIRVKGTPLPDTTTDEDKNEAPTTVAEDSGEIWHTIADGELVGRIAAKYGTTSKKIAELNPDINIDRVSIGQRIRVK